jgi:hypothetical protein
MKRTEAKNKANSFRMDKKFGKKSTSNEAEVTTDRTGTIRQPWQCDHPKQPTRDTPNDPKPIRTCGPADGVRQPIRCDPPKIKGDKGTGKGSTGTHTSLIVCDGLRGGGRGNTSPQPTPTRTCGTGPNLPPRTTTASTATGTTPTQLQTAQPQPSAQDAFKKRFAASKEYAELAKNAISITMRDSNPNPVDTMTDATLNPSGFKGYQGFKLNV